MSRRGRRACYSPFPSPSSVKEMPFPAAKPAPKTPVRATPAEAKPKPVTKAGAAEVKSATAVKPEAPKAGGGPVGDKGTDVATVRSDGIEFPFPGYLNNIVRQIALKFKPRNPAARLKAEVRFLIRRDGSVADIRSSDAQVVLLRLEAQGAVEAPTARAFGPLPDGFPTSTSSCLHFDPAFLK